MYVCTYSHTNPRFLFFYPIKLFQALHSVNKSCAIVCNLVVYANPSIVRNPKKQILDAVLNRSKKSGFWVEEDSWDTGIHLCTCVHRCNAASDCPLAFFVPFTVTGIGTPLASYNDQGVLSVARDPSSRS